MIEPVEPADFGSAQPGEAPVFVCGMGRSGTTWLGRALGQSPELIFLGEAWLIAKLEELGNWFRTVSEEWGDFTAWKGRDVDRAAFVERLAAFYLSLLFAASGGKRFVEKTANWNALHLRFLMELFPDAYFVLLYRDGRNQVASLEAKNLRQGRPFDFEACSARWARAMEVFQEVSRNPGTVKCRFVRYEDLLVDFESEFRELCRFVEIDPFTPEQGKANSSFSDDPGVDHFTPRWESWSSQRREEFARVAGAQLVNWGYADTMVF